jgi:hypothetical protein
MTFHHVIAKVGSDTKPRCLFIDLSAADLRSRFVKPYDRGHSFFSGTDLIAPSDIKSLQIISTARPEQIERSEINRRDLDRIDELNRSSDCVVIISPGAGYAPEDIAQAGSDVTQVFIKGPPGHKSGRWLPSLKVLGWTAGIAAAIIAAWLSNWLGLG